MFSVLSPFPDAMITASRGVKRVTAEVIFVVLFIIKHLLPF